MNFTETKNMTPREYQRRIFIDSLYRELDKIAEAMDSRNSKLIFRANQLLVDEGLSKDLCVDLLIMEGFKDTDARKCVEATASSIEVSSDLDEPMYKYDYCFEDHRGRSFSGKELGEMVTASSDKEAEVMIKEALADFDPPVHLISISRKG